VIYTIENKPTAGLIKREFMARIIREEENAARRNEILDVALRLLYTRGYDRMTIQDILDELRISKGAFYHYYDSKLAVLEALLERMIVEQVEPFLIPIVQDPRLSALEKFQRYVDSSVSWKTSKKTLMLEIAKVWHSDANALARQKLSTITVKRVMPWLVEIIRQGVNEGVFTTPYPDYIGQVSIHLVQGLGDAFIELFFSHEAEQDVIQRAEILVAVYNDTLERVLGAPKGSIHVMDPEALKEWFSSDEPLPDPKQALSQENGILEFRKP
jgi:AcrR family transcriptional regulator